MNLIQEAKNFAIAEIEKFGLPNLDHFFIAEKKGIEIAKELKADKTIVQVGVYLMDIKLGQAFKENKASQHVQMSVEASKEFLNKFDLEEVVKEKILNCVAAHHGEVPFKCIEAEICANADCYRFIHPKGFFVFLNTLGKRSSNFSECLLTAEKKMDEKYNILTIDICKKELEQYYRTLKQYINDARNL